VAGGLVNGGLSYARDVGAEAVQVFLSNPRGWARSAGDPQQDEEFRRSCADAKMPTFVHAPYLVNFGSPTETTLDNSVTCVRHALERAGLIGARGVVIHAGSAVTSSGRAIAMKQVHEHLLPFSTKSPRTVPIC
jgi:deoxyribonuclease-4